MFKVCACGAGFEGRANTTLCPDCRGKANRARARENRRARDSIMRDLGLVKVRGCVSGRIYWE